MRNLERFLIGIICAVVLTGGAVAAELVGTANVNITSETAAAAKNIALDEARRQIITDVLGQYSDKNQLRVAVKNAKASDLMNLISSSSIDGEKTSDTTYSANITMSVDDAAARRWMAENNVNSWMTDSAAVGNNFVVLVNMSDRMANWMELKRIARAQNVDIKTEYIMGNQALIELPVASRAAFVRAVQNAGWRYNNTDGTVHISK